MLTHIVRHIFRMPRPTNCKLGTRMEDDDRHQPQAPWPPMSKIKVEGHLISLRGVSPMVHKSKANSRHQNWHEGTP